MKNKIYNELNREPLVWGLQFSTLMLLVSFLVMSTTVYIHVMVVWQGILLAFGSCFFFYLVLVKYTAMDKIELAAWVERTVLSHRAVMNPVDSLKPCSQVLITRRER